MSITALELHSMWRAPSLDALVARVAERHGAAQKTVLLAGGTDWVVEQEMAKPVAPDAPLPLIVDISRLAELRGITASGNTLRIGAAATYLELRRHEATALGVGSFGTGSPAMAGSSLEAKPPRAALFGRMAQDLGALQIQARGTLGGNLATGSPAADGVTVLAAYDATVIVRSTRGERHIPMAQYQTGYKQCAKAPDEVIVAFEINVPSKHAWYWRKVGTRRAQAISKVALSAVAVVDSGKVTRVGFGMASVAPVTALLPNTRKLVLETALLNLTEKQVDQAVMSDISPIDDIRSTRVYRAHTARVLVKDFLRQLGAPI